MKTPSENKKVLSKEKIEEYRRLRLIANTPDSEPDQDANNEWLLERSIWLD